MTNENDLIRRGDALKAAWHMDGIDVYNAIAAIPAVADTPEVLALRNATRKVNNILADIADFDGDRRGHYGALEEAERKLIDAAIAALPAVAASQPADPVVKADSCQPEQMYLICKYGGYYRPNCRGYTSSIDEAGRYTLAEAEKETHPNGADGPRDGMTYIPAPPVKADSCQRVTVKPLVWDGHSDDQRVGDYVITPSYGQGPKRLLLARGSKLVSWHDDMDEAKAAGQADHEARIRAEIVTQPDPRDAVIARLVEAIENANDYDQDCECVSCTGLTLAIAAAKGGAA